MFVFFSFKELKKYFFTVALGFHCYMQPFSSCIQQGLLSVVGRGLSCPRAHGIFPEQGSNRRSPRWQADFQPMDHQRGLNVSILEIKLLSFVDSEKTQ